MSNNRNKYVLAEELLTYDLELKEFSDLLEEEGADTKDIAVKLYRDNLHLQQELEKQQKRFSEKLRRGKDYLFLIDTAKIELISCKIHDDHWLEYKFGKKAKKIRIMSVPKIFIQKGIFTFKQCRVYFAEREGEVTYDPADESDDELKKKFEAIIKTHGTVIKTDWMNNLAEGLKGKKSGWEYLPYFVIIAILFMILFYLSQYNLIKVG